MNLWQMRLDDGDQWRLEWIEDWLRVTRGVIRIEPRDGLAVLTLTAPSQTGRFEGESVREALGRAMESATLRKPPASAGRL